MASSAADPKEQLKEKLLAALDAKKQLNTREFAAEIGADHDDVVGAMKSLHSFQDLLSASQQSRDVWLLTEEGKAMMANGSHEFLVFSMVPAEGISKPDLMKLDAFKQLGEGGEIGLKQATRLKWIQPVKSDGSLTYKRQVDSVKDEIQELLRTIDADPNCANIPNADKALKDLKRRKLVEKQTLKSYDVQPGLNFTTNPVKADTDLTPEMLADGSWKTRDFRQFNLDAMGMPPSAGTLHPLLKVRKEYREIFLEMGFTEMPTARYVENSFWNFDALFQPQQHPARDAHDTFFMKEPATSSEFPEDYLERVRKVHSEGGYGSQGYKYDWKREEAQKNILRTHTTAVSARMLYELAQNKPFKPVKYFSIDRVFRNETLDATHLAEFHQIEGVIADYNLTLGDLMGVLESFFKRLGIENLSFKPAYNPYTEPSMEVFSYHAGLDKVVEIGNSGVFRPEMLRPMGLPDDVVVIAWGLSLERPTMIKYGYSNIRDLIGPKVNLQAAKEKPIVRV